jgi:hypothetical protein
LAEGGIEELLRAFCCEILTGEGVLAGIHGKVVLACRAEAGAARA